MTIWGWNFIKFPVSTPFAHLNWTEIGFHRKEHLDHHPQLIQNSHFKSLRLRQIGGLYLPFALHENGENTSKLWRHLKLNPFPYLVPGPAFWGLINPEWSLCNKGRRQSPVNLEPQRLLYDPNLRPLHIDKHRVSIFLADPNLDEDCTPVPFNGLHFRLTLSLSPSEIDKRVHNQHRTQCNFYGRQWNDNCRVSGQWK